MSPPSADDRLIEQLAASLRQEDQAVDEPGSSTLREQMFEMMMSSREGTPRPVVARNRTKRRWVIAGVSLAAAAAVTVLVLGLEPDEPRAVAASLPTYYLELDPGTASQRRYIPSPEGMLRYRFGNQFSWLMRPEVSVSTPVDVRVCARSASGDELELDVAAIRDPESSSSILLRGPVSSLGLKPGVWTVAIAVGAPQMLADLGSVCGASDGTYIQVETFELALLED
jgi:hypothetical protein